MLGNFSCQSAIKLYFGDDSLQYLNDELPKYGKTDVHAAVDAVSGATQKAEIPQ